MKNKSIAIKLFIITAVFFIVFTTITMVLQSLFFEKFYLNRKLKSFESNFNNLKVTLDKKNIVTNDILTSMLEFEDKNNAKSAIVNPLDNFKIYTAIKMDKNHTLEPGTLNISLDNNKMAAVTPFINEWFANQTYFFQVVNEVKTIVYKSSLTVNNIDNIVGVAPIVSNDRLIGIVFAISSLQPVGEASSTIKEFYIYFYALALILILILSLIYSNMIAKPLINMNKAAFKMSELDFSVKCQVNSQDEMGNLAGTLNFLSQKLGSTLDELKTANEKLTEDIESERHLEKMRKQFIAGVSHELKTPISLISGYAEGLKDNIPTEAEKDFYVDVIIDESHKMATLVSDMLDLSQLESGNFKLKINEFCIDELIRSMIKKFFNNLYHKEILIKSDFPNENLLVLGDRLRIEQVLTNLLSNAIRHTPNMGNIKIGIKDIENNVLIEVENQGQKIPEPELENIWEKFYKIDKSGNRGLGGTGIGLSIVKNILMLHKSDFGAYNIDDGVRFYFTLEKCITTK